MSGLPLRLDPTLNGNLLRLQLANGLTRLQVREAIRDTCGEGWLPLVDEVFENLPPHISITCAFQKWGALRFDLDPHNDTAFTGYLDDVAARSLEICETCGATGLEMIIDSWVVTRCDLHSAGWVWRSDQPDSEAQVGAISGA